MPEAKHTPGPWTAEIDVKPASGRRWKITVPTLKAGRRYTVAVVVNHDPADNETAAMDVRLIAAAPDMLAVCREARTLLNGLGGSDVLGDFFAAVVDEVAEKIDSAIAKATTPTEEA